MVSFKIIYYVLLVMFVLLASVFFWGFITYKRTRTETKFLNKPLFTLSIIMAVIGIAFTIVPLGMKLWIYDDSYIRSDPAFISILVFEFLFLVAFLILAYLFAYDFGIALDAENNTLQFFGQAINTEKIISLETKKNSLQVIYEQGYRNNKKKITIFTPKAKLFAKEVLVDIIARNQANREEIAAQQAILTQDINLDTNINEVNLENLDTTSVTTNIESNQEQQS